MIVKYIYKIIHVPLSSTSLTIPTQGKGGEDISL